MDGIAARHLAAIHPGLRRGVSSYTPLVASVLQIHWEYGHDYWVELRGQELSKELRRDLQEWNDEVCGLPPKAFDGRSPDRAQLERLNEVGVRLAKRASEELDDTWVVEYLDLLLDEPIRVQRSSVPARRRHHRS